MMDDVFEIPGIPDFNDKPYDDVLSCYACLLAMPLSVLKNKLEMQAEVLDCYAIHYMGKYLGRYFLG
jgi:hypothetical protein